MSSYYLSLLWNKKFYFIIGNAFLKEKEKYFVIMSLEFHMNSDLLHFHCHILKLSITYSGRNLYHEGFLLI